MIRMIILAVCFMVFEPLGACDICGGFSLNPQAGSITQVNRHFLSLTYGFVPFKAQNLTYSKDIFHNHIVQGQYMISDRWSLGASLLWSRSFRHMSESIIEVNGWGNPTAQVFYSPVLKNTGNGTWIWRTGVGLRLSLGTYEENIHDRNIPENFNPSDGAWGLTWQNDFVHIFDDWVFNVSSMTLLRGNSPDASKLGDQTNLQMSISYLYRMTKGWTISPLTGIGWEHLSPNRYPSKKTVNGTGGNNVFVHSGLSLNHDRGSLSARYTHPVHNGLNNSNIQTQGRWMIQATVFINS